METKECKIKLYSNLFKKGDDMTDNEIDIMFFLAQDDDIQNHLDLGRGVSIVKEIYCRSRSPYI